MDNIHEEKYNGLNIKIVQDNDPQRPDECGDENVFLVGYHRDFWVEVPKKMFSKDELISFFEKDKEGYNIETFKNYHVFKLEAYIHSGVSLALSNEGNFPDRQWDVSIVGAVLISKAEFKTRAKARKCALNLIETWNNYLSGNVYGYVIETDEEDHVDSCWGFYGDYNNEGGALKEAKAIVDHMTNKGKTDHKGQVLLEFVKG